MVKDIIISIALIFCSVLLYNYGIKIYQELETFGIKSEAEIIKLSEDDSIIGPNEQVACEVEYQFFVNNQQKIGKDAVYSGCVSRRRQLRVHDKVIILYSSRNYNISSLLATHDNNDIYMSVLSIMFTLFFSIRTIIKFLNRNNLVTKDN